MFMLAFFAVASRFFVQNRNRLYEQSRWMVVAALLLFGVHYMMQMLFGWRAKGDDIGTLFNILFYIPCALLLANSRSSTSSWEAGGGGVACSSACCAMPLR